MKNIFITAFFIFSKLLFSQEIITADLAKDFIEKTVSVQGKVVSFKLASDSKSINYINIDKKFPDNIFTVIVTNNWLPKLDIKIEDLIDKTIIIKGKISIYKNDPKQIPQIFNPETIIVKK